MGLVTALRGISLCATDQPLKGEFMAQIWEDRHALAFEVFVPWIEKVRSLQGASVLEFGSGMGAAATAWARAGANVTGVDIDSPDTDEAISRAERLGLTNVEFVNGEFEYIKGLVASKAKTIDVFMLYAVLEHMTPEERLSTLELARDIIAPGGIIVVAESPNRHLWLDEHTATIPFFDQLPDAYAKRLAGTVPRQDIADNLREAFKHSPEHGSLTRSRLGRGIGHQEFEYVFGALGPITMHCNWEPEIMLRSQGVTREQIALSRFMARNCPSLPPSFSRYYLDFILKPDGGRAYPYVRPLPLKTEGSRDAFYTEYEMINVLPGGSLVIDTPEAAGALVVGITVHPSMTDHGVRMNVVSGDSLTMHETRKFDPGTPSWVVFEEIDVVPGSQRVMLDPSDFLEVSFIGYRPS